MENIRVLLTGASGVRSARRVRAELIQFFDSVLLFLSCGYDLSHAWHESVLSVGKTSLSITKGELEVGKDSGMTGHLCLLAEKFSQTDFRQWFSLLERAYTSGSPMIPAVRAASDAMRRDQAREFEEHCRLLPGRTNILLLLFFLPPAMLLIFSPLLLAFGALF